MKTFECRVTDSGGHRQVLQKSGPSEDMVVRDLTQAGFFVLSLKEVQSRELPRSLQRKLPEKVVGDFTSTLQLLLSSGLGIKDALRVSKDIFKKPQQRQFIEAVSDQIEKGSSLHDALLPWSRSFGPLYLGLIKIGEKTGDLAPIFQRLQEYGQTRKVIRNKEGNAMIYPLLVLGVSLLGTLLLIIFVFPQLASIVGSLNKDASRQFQEKIQGFQTGFYFFAGFLGILVSSWIGVRVASQRSPEFRARWHGLLLSLPLIKGVLEIYHGLNFAFALETLLQGGYSVEVSLEEASLILSNEALRRRVLAIRELVLKGKPLSEAFSTVGGFSDRFLTWISVGEQAGDLSKVFSQLRQYYQHELENLSTKFVNLMEPALILALGVFMIVLVLNFIAPVFSMLGNVVK